MTLRLGPTKKRSGGLALPRARTHTYGMAFAEYEVDSYL